MIQLRKRGDRRNIREMTAFVGGAIPLWPPDVSAPVQLRRAIGGLPDPLTAASGERAARSIRQRPLAPLQPRKDLALLPKAVLTRRLLQLRP